MDDSVRISHFFLDHFVHYYLMNLIVTRDLKEIPIPHRLKSSVCSFYMGFCLSLGSKCVNVLKETLHQGLVSPQSRKDVTFDGSL